MSNTGITAYLKALGKNDTAGEPVGMAGKIRAAVNAVIAAAIWFFLDDWTAEDVAVLMLAVNTVLSVILGAFVRDRATPAYYLDPMDDPSVPVDDHENPEEFHNA